MLLSRIGILSCMIRFFKNEHTVSISPSIIVYTVGIVLLTYFLFYIKTVLAMLFSAVIIMSALNPAIQKLEHKWKLPRILGILIMYALIIVVFGVTISIIVPPLVIQLQSLTKNFDFLVPVQEEIRNFKFSITQLDTLLTSLGGSVSTAFAIITGAFNGVFTVFTVMVMSSYLLIDRKNLYKKVGWFTTDKKMYDLAKTFVDSIESQLGGWVRGQLILMVVIGLTTYLGLSLLRVPYALPLAILAGFLEILPNLGPTIAAVPAIGLAFLSGGWFFAGLVTLFYIVVQQLENNIIVPKIMKDNADVNPLATIVTILIGVKLAGFMGALLSVPLYIVLRTVYSYWLREK